MPYKVNGTALRIQPTTGRWQPRAVKGIDADNRAIYEPTYSFKLSWDTETPDAFNELYLFWKGVSSTGVVSVDLPQKDSPTYQFLTYQNCVIDEPQPAEFFEQHILKVEVLIRNIIL